MYLIPFPSFIVFLSSVSFFLFYFSFHFCVLKERWIQDSEMSCNIFFAVEADRDVCRLETPTLPCLPILSPLVCLQLKLSRVAVRHAKPTCPRLAPRHQAAPGSLAGYVTAYVVTSRVLGCRSILDQAPGGHPPETQSVRRCEAWVSSRSSILPSRYFARRLRCEYQEGCRAEMFQKN